MNIFFHSLLVLIYFTVSPLGGGGGGSCGAVSFSACALTAGSSAIIEAKGGTGGQARSYGTRLLCRVFCLAILISHSNPILNEPHTLLTQDIAVVEEVEEPLPSRYQLSIMMIA